MRRYMRVFAWALWLTVVAALLFGCTAPIDRPSSARLVVVGPKGDTLLDKVGRFCGVSNGTAYLGSHLELSVPRDGVAVCTR